MNTPLIWLNLVLAIALGVVYTQRDLLVGGAEKSGDLVLIAIGDSASFGEFQRAARSFEDDLGRSVTVINAEDNALSLARALKRAIALKPTGVSMPGIPDHDLLLPFVVEAERRGVRVTFHTAPFPEAGERFRLRGAGFIGTGGQANGELATRNALETLRYEKGRAVLLAGTEDFPAPGTRLFGCQKAVEEAGGVPEYIQIRPAPESDAALAADSALVSRIRQLPPPVMVFWDAGDTGWITEGLEEQGFDFNDVSIISFAPVTGGTLLGRAYVKHRVYGREFLTGYVSLLQLYLADRAGIPGMQISINASL